ncbi:MAG TPA: hypothetical protein VM299_06610 [Solirubrobacteraceae bacterium]|jgi:hypothetical protein|nr:hypothetical protein [Solirubrobacteraceae bacterium]
MKRLFKPKKGCCKSDPRCKRCPVVAKRLVKRGLAERRSDGLVLIYADVKKKKIRAARKR